MSKAELNNFLAGNYSKNFHTFSTFTNELTKINFQNKQIDYKKELVEEKFSHHNVQINQQKQEQCLKPRH